MEFFLLMILVISGIYLTIYTKMFVIKNMFKIKNIKYSFKGLMISLAASLGIGNIIGVSSAIIYGGAGSIFWIWVMGFIGLTVRFFEASLASKYHKSIMDIALIKNKKFIAYMFSILLLIVGLGTGNSIQSNSLYNVLNSNYNINKYYFSVFISIMVFIVIYKGNKRIEKTVSIIIPFITVIFVLFLILSLIKCMNFKNVLYIILEDAFDFKGVIGSGMYYSIKYGMSRGVFSNEAGMGSSTIAFKDSKNNNIIEGLNSSISIIVDTFITSTLVAFLLLSNEFNNDVIKYVYNTFNNYFLGNSILLISVIMFSYATIIGWYYYSLEGFLFIFDKRYEIIFKIIYIILTGFGVIFSLDFIWNISVIFNSLMIIPTLIIIFMFKKEIKKDIIEFKFKNL